MTAPDPVQRLREAVDARDLSGIGAECHPLDATLADAADALLNALPEMLQAEKIKTLNEAADEIDATYPPDVFIPPEAEWLAEIAAWIEPKGRTMDALSAHIIRTAPRILRHMASVAAADELARETREQGHES